jgi:hypothetical protein
VGRIERSQGIERLADILEAFGSSAADLVNTAGAAHRRTTDGLV